ncbi:hypothetical protein [Brevibacillus sp. 179-C9.3 HS]|uniref:hypothetical protein n=1 Tax=unclassified Brevibacillus TaxID=2684853 RepID=UPI0039A2DBC4
MQVEELKEILSGPDHEEKIVILSHLCDIFESYNTVIDNFEELILVLLDFGINEQNPELKEEIFNTILTAATYNDIDKINFDILADNLENLSEECLHSAFTTLSFTYKKKYLSLLTRYANHENRSIRADAVNAINEIEGYWAKKSN